MVITLHTANICIRIISFILAYGIVTTLSNCFKAWVAGLMGDDTGEQLGFLSFNPANHFDPIGFILTLLYQFGWGRYIPVDPTRIKGQWRIPKIIITFLSNSIACIVIACVALIILMGMFGYHIVNITSFMMLYHALSYRILAAAYPTHHSIYIAIGTILIATMYFSIVLSVLQAVVNGVYATIVCTSHKVEYRNLDTIMLIILLGLFVIFPLLGIFDIVNLLRLMVVHIITYTGYAFASLVGIK